MKRFVLAAMLAATLSWGQQRPRLVGLSHIAVRVHDLDTARKFYTGLLGYQEAFTVLKDHTAVVKGGLAQSQAGAVFFKVNNRQYIVVVPESENGLEPLCACWRMEAAAAVQAAFEGGVRKVTEAMKRLPMEVLDESAWKRFDTENRLFWNMNTPADFDEARRILEAS